MDSGDSSSSSNDLIGFESRDGTGSDGVPAEETSTDEIVVVDGENNDEDDEIRIVGVSNGTNTVPGNHRMHRNDNQLWKKFQFQNHSLVLYASNVAACTGYNPFVSCPEMMMQHVYQGRGGMALLKHDMEVLGLEYDLKSEEEELMEIAQQAGAVTAKKVRQVLDVKRGEKKLESVEKAQQLRQEVAQEAEKSKKLSKRQLKILQDGTRYSVDTGCGHSWEDSALDQYSLQCGWEVNERNAECRHWKFMKTVDYNSNTDTIDLCEDSNGKSDESRKRKRQEDFIPSLVPLGPASIPCRSNQQVDSESSRKEGSNSNDSSSGPSEDNDLKSNELESFKPYVVIRGMVDGIREELAPRLSRSTNNVSGIAGYNDYNDDDDDDDDSWVIRRVIVECKHRMRTILPAPRFHEVIQAVIYCMMYDAEEVDIVQVLRTTPKKAEKKSQRVAHSSQGQTNKVEDVQREGKVALPTCIHDKAMPTTISTTTAMNENHVTKASDTNSTRTESQDVDVTDQCPPLRSTQQSGGRSLSSAPFRSLSTNMELSTSRISLNESDVDHVSNWNNIVLPNLRQWVDAVYRIRSSDEKRYLLLNSMAVASSQIDDDDDDDNLNRPTIVQDALRTTWELVCNECPFLAYGPSGDKMRKDLKPTNHRL